MEYIKLCDIASINAGGTPSRDNNSYWNGQIPWLKISDIKGKYTDSCTEYITEEGLNNSSAKYFKKNTILYTIFATIGETSILKFDATTNQAIAGIKLINDNFLVDYLYYYLKSLKKRVKHDSKGVAQNNINLTYLKKLNVPNVNINIQKQIVKDLTNIEELILRSNKMQENLDNIVKSQFIEMFSSYEKVKLCDLAEIIMGQSPNSKTYNDYSEGVPFFQGKADFGDKYTIVRHWTNKPIKIARKNSVLLSVRAPVGPVNLANEDCCIGRGLCSINALEKKTNNEFLYNALKIIEKELSLMGSGSTFKAINKNDVQNLIIPDAPYNKQIEYVNFISQIDKSKYFGGDGYGIC